MTTDTEHPTQVPLVESGTALDSMRNSDFDVYSAYGEVVDNSLQASAKHIKIQMLYKPKSPILRNEPIGRIGFGDDGHGMNTGVLHRCLQLGYSSRYNDRSGIGRFGVGATLAAINQCKRVEVYSKVEGGKWLYTYFDLQDITSHKMTGIPEPTEATPPKEFAGLVGEKSGTLVIWDKYDRQPDDASEILKNFTTWVGRAYRKFISSGVTITLNGQNVPAIDPLYLDLSKTQFPDDPKAFEFTPPITIEWPIPLEDQKPDGPTKSIITIRMSLLPEEFRKNQGAGNSKMAIERHIPENEGVSILRNGREVFFDHIPHWPGKHFSEIDRWWGCEISFDAILDKEFTVKNIKRGAVPVRDLKGALAAKINPTRETALERVREVWIKAKTAELVTPTGGGITTGHEDAEQAAKKTPTPKGVLDAGKDIDKESAKFADEWLKNEDERQKAAWEAKFKSQPFTIMDADWKGPEFVETSHLGGSDVLRYNVRHPFFTELASIRAALEASGQDTTNAKRLRVLIDLLLISHAKAETMIDPKIQWPPEQLLETLRMQWGQYLSNYIGTYKKENDIK
jgi:hypothetical protein